MMMTTEITAMASILILASIMASPMTNMAMSPVGINQDYASSMAASDVDVNVTTPPTCLQKWGYCNVRNCIWESSGQKVRNCPECCGDLMCMYSDIGLTCQERQVSLQVVCDTLQNRTNIGVAENLRSSATKFVLNDIYNENCTFDLLGNPTLGHVCGMLSSVVGSFTNVYTAKYTLYDSRGGNCWTEIKV